MINLILILSTLIVLPILLGYVHSSINKRVPAAIIIYRYFVFFNVVIAGLFVASRMFFNGTQAAQIAGWAYSPMFHSYSLAILSMTILALLTIFTRSHLILAPAICWSIFLLLSTIWHFYLLRHHGVSDMSIMYVHSVYDLISAVVMAGFIHPIYKIYQRYYRSSYVPTHY